MAAVSNNSALDYDDYSSTKIESRRQIGEILNAIANSVFLAHIIIASFGICANGYVIFRVVRLARNDPDKYRNGTGIGLLSMSVADFLSLLSISIHFVLVLAPINASNTVKTCVCRILLFSTHTMTSVSIWSWLLMSAVRYLAIRHPMAHLRLWNMPKRAITFFWFMSSATNVWLLFAIDFGRFGCEQNRFFDIYGSRLANLIEIIWSAFLPITIIFYMDVSVVFGRALKFKSIEFAHDTEFLRKDTHTKNKSAVRIWLTMAFVDALLNIPDTCYRFLMMFGILDTIPSHYHYTGRMIGQLLYFGQFAFNALYLAVFVYDKSTEPRAIRHNSSRLGSLDVS